MQIIHSPTKNKGQYFISGELKRNDTLFLLVTPEAVLAHILSVMNDLIFPGTYSHIFRVR